MFYIMLFLFNGDWLIRKTVYSMVSYLPMINRGVGK